MKKVVSLEFDTDKFIADFKEAIGERYKLRKKSETGINAFCLEASLKGAVMPYNNIQLSRALYSKAINLHRLFHMIEVTGLDINFKDYFNE